MKLCTPLNLTIVGGLAAAALGAGLVSVSAQTATTTSTTSTSSSSAKKVPTTATADMVDEAIQRSKARAAKAQQYGTPEQFGSEEPFTYDPTKKTFTSAQQ